MSLRELWQCCGAECAGGYLKGVVVGVPPNDILSLFVCFIHTVFTLIRV
jgi:hypothetical protein